MGKTALWSGSVAGDVPWSLRIQTDLDDVVAVEGAVTSAKPGDYVTSVQLKGVALLLICLVFSEAATVAPLYNRSVINRSIVCRRLAQLHSIYCIQIRSDLA